MSTSGSYMFIGTNKKDRLESISEFFKLGEKQNKLNTRVLEIPEEKKSLGIGEIRDAIKYVAIAPSQNKHKYLVIPQAESMTTEAQNALLKTLEEPPSYAVIALGVPSEGSVLGTVASRCKKKIVKTKEVPINKDELTWNKVHVQSVGDRLAEVESFAKQDKELILSTLDNWVADIRKGYLAGDVTVSASNNVKLILKVREDLHKTAVNTRLALEYLVSSLV